MLLVTRPQPSAAETARTLRARGHRCAIAPLLAVQPKPVRAVDASPYQVIVVTSGAAARALAAWHHLHALPAVAVGDKTAALLRAAGFKKVISANGAAADAVDVVRRRYNPRRGGVLVACAPSTGHAVAARLKTYKFSARRLSVYSVNDAPLPAAAVTFLRGAGMGDGALFYSARTARAFVAAIKKSRLNGQIKDTINGGCTKKLIAYCLSEAVAKAARQVGWRHVQVAARPTEEALLALLPHGRGLKSDEQRSIKPTNRRTKAGKK
jgi:uroporphyrinogen-III synthase